MCVIINFHKIYIYICLINRAQEKFPSIPVEKYNFSSKFYKFCANQYKYLVYLAKTRMLIKRYHSIPEKQKYCAPGNFTVHILKLVLQIGTHYGSINGKRIFFLNFNIRIPR